MTALRWLAFGDLDGAVWGTAWFPGERTAGHAVLGAGHEARVAEAQLDAGADPGEDWRLRAEGLELRVSPSGARAGDSSAAAGEGLDQLVRATGTATIDRAERRVDSHGWRAAQPGLPEPGELDSLRLLAAWFDRDDGLALLALRPRKARGQEGDRVIAALIEAGRVRSVSDPRLSTTYSGEGVPARAGVELWVSEPSEDPGAVSERPHRVAGEATGAPTGWSQDKLELTVQPFRWHSHGRDGVGVYLLGRPA